MDKTRVLMEAENYYPSVELTYASWRKAAEYLSFELKFVLSRDLTPEIIDWCDIVISVRGISCISAELSRICKKTGKLFFYCIDDNLFAHQRTDIFMRRRQSYLQECLDNADAIIVPNPYLGEYLVSRSRVSRYAVMDSIVEADDMSARDSFDDSPECRFAYYSSAGDFGYFRNIVVPALRNLHAALREDISVDLIGITKTDDLSFDGVTLNCLPSMSLSQFRQQLRDGKYRMGLAPLNAQDDGFSKYKYFNKYIEFTMAGIVGVYSNCPPYDLAITNGYNGILCDNSPESWVNALSRYAGDFGFLKKTLDNAQKHLLDNFSAEAVSRKLGANLPELSAYKAPNRSSCKSFLLPKWKHGLFVWLERAGGVWRFAKKGGLKAVAERVRQYRNVRRQNNEELRKSRETK